MDLVQRPLTLADAPEVLQILQEAEQVEPAGQHFDLAEVQETLAGPEVDLERGSVALLDQDQMVAFGHLSLLGPHESWRAYLMGGVRTDHLGQGLGSRVLRVLADQARALRDADEPTRPGELKLWVPDRRPRLGRLAARHGYTVRRYFRDMQHDLQVLPARTDLPAGLVLRDFHADLSEATRLASNAAFADHFGSGPLTPELWQSAFGGEYLRSDLSVLAVDPAAAPDDSVVGFVLVEQYPAETQARGMQVGYVARVGTVARVRGLGVASTLLAEVLHRLAAAGFGVAELNVDSASPTGADRLYTRLGFVPTHLNTQWSLDF